MLHAGNDSLLICFDEEERPCVLKVFSLAGPSTYATLCFFDVCFCFELRFPSLAGTDDNRVGKDAKVSRKAAKRKAILASYCRLQVNQK